MQPNFKKTLEKFTREMEHPARFQLLEIFCGESSVTSSGFPFISEESFEVFKSIPHLFTSGLSLLNWITCLKTQLPDSTSFTEEELGHIQRICKVLQTVIYTASITAPPDLWILRHVLDIHSKMGTLEWLSQGNILNVDLYASKHKLNAKQLKLDISLLYSRGYLSKKAEGYIFSPIAQMIKLEQISPIGKIKDWSRFFMQLFQDPSRELKEQAKDFLDFPLCAGNSKGWQAGIFEIELGYRLVPVVLALRALDWTAKLKADVLCREIILELSGTKELFQKAGMVNQEERVTKLGARVFARGAGPFGIIYTYHSYMKVLDKLLQGKPISSWVNRGENVAASQDANSKTFLTANRTLDAFCEKYKYNFNVFIEHAVGQGEATRQRFETDKEKKVQYFGADLEQAAIAKAVENQQLGILPQNMIFIQADIGDPQKLIEEIHQAKYNTEAAVMLVGNGFHEIRAQTNEKMIKVFEGYQQAGILLIFTEESALNDEDLITTAWNTYHTGFRYVHEISGQGLRPVYDLEDRERFSWEKCATLAGYKVLPRYTTKTRTIYPHPRKNGYNPSISANYFCVPQKLAQRLGIKD